MNDDDRIGEKMDKKQEIIDGIKEEVRKMNRKLKEYEERVNYESIGEEGKVERYIVKNMVMGYLIDKKKNRRKVIRIVENVLELNKEERERVGLE